MFLNVICLLILVAAIIMAIHVAWQYKQETGPGLQRLWATARHSATYFVGKLGVFLSALSLNLDKIADALGQPQLTDSLDKIGANPKTIGAVLLVASLAAIAARLRTL